MHADPIGDLLEAVPFKPQLQRASLPHLMVHIARQRRLDTRCACHSVFRAPSSAHAALQIPCPNATRLRPHNVLGAEGVAGLRLTRPKHRQQHSLKPTLKTHLRHLDPLRHVAPLSPPRFRLVRFLIAVFVTSCTPLIAHMLPLSVPHDASKRNYFARPNGRIVGEGCTLWFVRDTGVRTPRPPASARPRALAGNRKPACGLAHLQTQQEATARRSTWLGWPRRGP